MSSANAMIYCCANFVSNQKKLIDVLEELITHGNLNMKNG